jgi:mRNA interferase MazF
MVGQNKTRVPQIGEVYYMRFGGTGSEQEGFRPGLVFQNNMGNAHSPNIIALPMTSVMKKLGQPTHVFVNGKEAGLKKNSLVLCENPECMSKERIGGYITKLPDKYMKQIATASLLASSVIAYLDVDALVKAWQKAVRLNANMTA